MRAFSCSLKTITSSFSCIHGCLKISPTVARFSGSLSKILFKREIASFDISSLKVVWHFVIYFYNSVIFDALKGTVP
jgi:hypothetical protein